jgi:hypothetical protein
LDEREKVLDADFDEAAKKTQAESDASRNETTEQKNSSRAEQKWKFTDAPINDVIIIKNVPMRFSVAGACDLLLTQLKPGGSFDLSSFDVTFAVYTVKSENSRLVSFNECGGGNQIEFTAFIFSMPDGEFSFGIPVYLIKIFEVLRSRTPP